MKRILLLFLFLFVVNIVFSATNSEIIAMVRDCVIDIENCDCSQFDEQGQSFCEEQLGLGYACLADLSSQECQNIDLTIVDNYVGGQETLYSIINTLVRQYIPEIEECVNLESGCDCTQFPGGVAEYCENYGTLQIDCLENYNLEACNTLEAQDIEVLPSWTPGWLRPILEPLIRPLVEFRQDMMRTMAIGSAMQSVGECFNDPYNCDCSSIEFYSIRSDCEQRANYMRTCLDYRDCALAAGTDVNCTGIEACNGLVNMPLVPEATPGFIVPFIEPIVLQNVCPMMQGWPYEWGNYAECE